MSLNLYDLLDVDEHASADEIRAAWKAAIADLDPTDRRFRAYNEAAGVLLDADKRAAYDADLAAARAEEEPEAVEPEPAEPEPAPIEDTDATAEDEPADEDTTGGEDETGGEAAGATAAARFAEDPPDWALGAVGLLAVLALALAIWVATWPGTFGGTPPDEREQMRRDAVSAVAAAEKAAEVVFGYDYRTMDQGIPAGLLTPAFAKEQAAVLAELRPEAVAQKAVVTAAVRGSGLARISEDGDQALVVVFADQLVQKDGRTANELWQSTTLRMVRDDGAWLLEKICTTDPECGE